MATETQPLERKTRRAFIWTSVLKSPLFTLQAILAFILHKELHATPFQLALFFALKPAVSIFSVYWSALIHKRPDRLKANVILAGLIAYFPFFLFPVIKSSWLVITAWGLFWMMHRGIIPAWMEILKRNIPPGARQRTFSYGTSLSWIMMAILPIFFGRWMDIDADAWRILFPIMAFLALGGMIFEWRIPIAHNPKEEAREPVSSKETLLRPWKNALHLFKTRPDFMRYQMGFMLGGGALMIMHPALPGYFCDTLKLSYVELSIALAICKGVGYALTSRVWASWMDKLNIYRFSSIVTILAGLFPIALMAARIEIAWVYIAYLAYGVMQAGSEMSWHMSGPIFSKDEDSSSYSSVNVVTVGLRGLFAPFLGASLCGFFSASTVLLLGGVLCALASFQLGHASRRSQLTAD